MITIIDDKPTCLVRVDGTLERRYFAVNMEGCMPCKDIELNPGEKFVDTDINDPYPSIMTITMDFANASRRDYHPKLMEHIRHEHGWLRPEEVRHMANLVSNTLRAVDHDIYRVEVSSTSFSEIPGYYAFRLVEHDFKRRSFFGFGRTYHLCKCKIYLRITVD